jgi:hypothetical protein
MQPYVRPPQESFEINELITNNLILFSSVLVSRLPQMKHEEFNFFNN